MAAKKKAAPVNNIIAENRKARYNYELSDNVEAGLMLTGTEVKALRDGKANIAESYASVEDNELWLINSYIPEYRAGNRNNHEPRRHRKLLLSRREIDRMMAATAREGMTIVPLKMYFNQRGMVKLELAMAKGKKVHDKRQTEKNRDWQREKGRLLREKG